MIADETYERRSCRACHAEMVMVEMSGGRLNPCNAVPTSIGNVRLTGDGKGEVLGKRAVEDDTSGELYLSHFATCPSAARFKGQRR